MAHLSLWMCFMINVQSYMHRKKCKALPRCGHTLSKFIIQLFEATIPKHLLMCVDAELCVPYNKMKESKKKIRKLKWNHSSIRSIDSLKKNNMKNSTLNLYIYVYISPVWPYEHYVCVDKNGIAVISFYLIFFSPCIFIHKGNVSIWRTKTLINYKICFI